MTSDLIVINNLSLTVMNYPSPFCFFNLIVLLSAYYWCTWGILWHLQKGLQYILVRFFPSTIHPYVSHSQNSFSMYHFSIFIYEYIRFPSYSLSYTLFLNPSPSQRYLPLDRTHFYFPVFCFWKKDFFVCLR
jgi:hypothetical protein